MKKGFTLIEMIIVVGVISFLLPTLFSIIFTLFRQQYKILALNLVKKEGDFALTQIESAIRANATGIYSDAGITPVCNTSGAEYDGGDGAAFYLKNQAGEWFRFQLSSGRIASNSATTNANLTSPRVLVTDFDISCEKTTSFTLPLVSVSYTVDVNTTSERDEDTASFPYQFKVKLRNE